jgi:pimeloyl-ACP methyl ester carboxylesterase
LPYGPRDTLRPISELTARLGEQVDALHNAYGEPVTIVAESEGALVARAYLLSRYEPADESVDRLITLDMPKVGAGAYYPPAGETGWGLGAGWGLRGLAALAGNIGFVSVSADAPFFRSLVGCTGLLATIGTQPLPAEIPETRVIALADAVDDYLHDPRVASYVVGTHHGGLLDREEVQRVIADTISGMTLRGSGTSLAWVRVIGKLSAPWTLPGVKQGLAPAETC